MRIIRLSMSEKCFLSQKYNIDIETLERLLRDIDNMLQSKEHMRRVKEVSEHEE